MAIPGMPQAKILASMERFGAKVMPMVERAAHQPEVSTA